MKNQKTILLKIFYVCATVVVLTPLLYSGPLINSKLLLKVSVFQILICVMAAVWIALMLSDKDYRPKKHPLAAVIMVFVAVLFVNLAFSIEPYFSFWSRTVRLMGIYHLLYYVVWFLMLVSVFKTWQQWKKLFITSNVVCLIIEAFGILILFQSSYWRLESIFDNPAFFAAYVLPHIFIASILWVREKSRRLKIFFGISVTVHVLSLFLSGSRSAMLGLAVAFLVGIFIYLLKSGISKNRKRVYAGSFIFLLAIAVSTFTLLKVFTTPEWGRHHLPVQVNRIVYQTSDPSRLGMWDIAWQGFMERPVVGFGYENFGYVFGKYVEPAGAHAAIVDNWSERVHNQFLELLVTTGAVGLASYLLIWFVLFYLLARSLKKTKGRDSMVTAILFSMAIGYMVQLFFLFDVPSATMILFSLFAFAVYHTDSLEENLSRKQYLSFLPVFKVGTVTIFVLLLLTGSFQYVFTIKPLMAAMANESGYIAMQSDHELALEEFKQSLSRKTYLDPDFRYRLMQAISENGLSVDGVDRDILIFAAQETEKSAAAFPTEFNAQFVGSVAQFKAIPFDETALEESKEMGEKALALAPHRSEAREQMAEIAIYEKDYETAQKLLEEAAGLAQKYRLGALHSRLALVYANLGLVNETLETIELSRDEGYPVYSNPAVIILLADNIEADYPNSERVVGHLIGFSKAHSSNIDVLIAAIKIYAKTGDADGASELLKILETADTNTAEQLKIQFDL